MITCRMAAARGSHIFGGLSEGHADGFVCVCVYVSLFCCLFPRKLARSYGGHSLVWTHAFDKSCFSLPTVDVFIIHAFLPLRRSFEANDAVLQRPNNGRLNSIDLLVRGWRGLSSCALPACLLSYILHFYVYVLYTSASVR